jgi:hypothetical protein
MVRKLKKMRQAAGVSGRQDLTRGPLQPGRHVPVDQLPTIARVRQDGLVLGHDRPDLPGPGSLFLAADVFSSEGADDRQPIDPVRFDTPVETPLRRPWAGANRIIRRRGAGDNPIRYEEQGQERDQASTIGFHVTTFFPVFPLGLACPGPLFLVARDVPSGSGARSCRSRAHARRDLGTHKWGMIRPEEGRPTVKTQTVALGDPIASPGGAHDEGHPGTQHKPRSKVSDLSP